MSFSTGPRPRHPALAAVLSFVFPGLGQLYAGQMGAALLLAAPVLLLAVVIWAAFFLGWSSLRNDLLSSTFLWGLMGLDLLLLAWRVAAIGHAWLKTDVPDSAMRRETREPAGAPQPLPQTELFPVARARLVTERLRRSPLTIGLVAAMLLATVAMHSYVAILAGTLNMTLGNVFTDVGGVAAGGSEGQTDSGVVEGPYLNVPDYHWDGTERINFLLVGVDYLPGREHALDDTVLVASIDPSAEEAVLISIPRDTAYMPLPDSRIYADGLYPNRINELATQARGAPEIWCPDLPPAVDCGVRTLQQTVSLYLGIPIHHYARVDLVGFSQIIDALGGVEVCLDGRLVDPEYSGPTWHDRPRGVVIEPGCHELDGPEALAYARIRKGYLELPDGTIEYQNDFARAERQQELLLSLRRALEELSPLELPAVVGAVGETISTDFPRSMAGDLASLIPLITRSGVEQVVLGYPEFVDPPIDPDNFYALIPRRDAIREEMLSLFREEGRLEGWYLGEETVGVPPVNAADSP